MMIIEQILNNAQNPLLHIADVSGSALFQGDCLDIMPLIPDKSVQLILTDLPYGITQNKWDSVLPLDKLWIEYNRILKDGGVVILTTTQPFTTLVINSNLFNFHHEWVWHKSKPSGVVFKNQPMRNHENILVFNKPGIFNAILEEREGFTDSSIKRFSSGKNLGTYRNHGNSTTGIGFTELKPIEKLRKPTTIKRFASVPNRLGTLHPTQKPLELMKYLISTYSNENDMVLDNTMGSGTTCLAAKELNRKFIGIEKEPKYYEIACQRCGF